MPSHLRPSLAEDATPEQAAAASHLCLGYFPSCFATDCRRGGECFKPRGRAYGRVRKELTALLAKADREAAVWYHKAIDALDSEYRSE